MSEKKMKKITLEDRMHPHVVHNWRETHWRTNYSHKLTKLQSFLIVSASLLTLGFGVIKGGMAGYESFQYHNCVSRINPAYEEFLKYDEKLKELTNADTPDKKSTKMEIFDWHDAAHMKFKYWYEVCELDTTGKYLERLIKEDKPHEKCLEREK